MMLALLAPSTLAATLSGTILYTDDSYRLSEREPGTQVLVVEAVRRPVAFATVVARPLRRPPISDFCRSLVEIYGYADTDGSDAYNVDLSLRRATTIRECLMSQGVAERSRISIFGYGKLDRYTVPDGPDPKAENRRAEIAIIPSLGGG